MLKNYQRVGIEVFKNENTKSGQMEILPQFLNISEISFIICRPNSYSLLTRQIAKVANSQN